MNNGIRGGHINENTRAINILGNPFEDEKEKKEYLTYLGEQFPELYMKIVLNGTDNIAEILRQYDNNDN